MMITTFCILYLSGFVDKWISEPLRAIIISSKLFSVNKKKNLFLPPRLQQILVTLCSKFQVKVLMFSCCSYTRVVQYCRCQVKYKIVCLFVFYVFFDNSFITYHKRSLYFVLFCIYYYSFIIKLLSILLPSIFFYSIPSDTACP